MKYIVVLLAALVSTNVFAETVWCKALNLGCETPEEKAKKAANCQRLANETYQTAIVEALGDPSIWQLAGYKSAREYATARQRQMLYQCMN